MILIEDNFNLFNLNEKEILEKKYLSFTLTSNPSKNEKSANYYVRSRIPYNDREFKCIVSKINDYVAKLSKKDNIILNACWINKVTKETNKNDKFHKDSSDLTFLMYLNDDFIGGEYEYIEPETKSKEKIKPKKYLSIVITKDISHRVKPVLEGERYSIVFFYNLDKKTNKTLI